MHRREQTAVHINKYLNAHTIKQPLHANKQRPDSNKVFSCSGSVCAFTEANLGEFGVYELALENNKCTFSTLKDPVFEYGGEHGILFVVVLCCGSWKVLSYCGVLFASLLWSFVCNSLVVFVCNSLVEFVCHSEQQTRHKQASVVMRNQIHLILRRLSFRQHVPILVQFTILA